MLELDERPIGGGRRENSDPATRVTEGPRNTGLWVAFAVLLCGLIGVAGYGYRTLKRDGIKLAQVPELASSLGGLSGRLQAAESAINVWGGDKQRLMDRVGLAERRINSGLKQARKHADEATEQLEARIEDEIEERSAVVESRLGKIEATQANEREQLARLQDELASAHQEIAALHQATDGQFASLDQHMAGNDRSVEALAQRLDRKKLEFEVAKNQDIELTPGVALKVLNTDVRFQRFSGWIEVLPEARFLWVSDQSIQQPVAFYRQQDSERLDLVVTRVARNSVVGYLLVPAGRKDNAGGPVARLDSSASLPPQTR